MERETSDELERQLVTVLERLSVPVEIAQCRACSGQTYYEWWVTSKHRHGIACTFPEAVHEALDSFLKAS